MPYQWKTSLSTQGNLIGSFLQIDISYNGAVLLASQEGEVSKMTMLSSATGEVLWEWNDLFDKNKYFNVVRQYQHKQYLAFKQGTRFYTLDLSSGATLRKEEETLMRGGCPGSTRLSSLLAIG